MLKRVESIVVATTKYDEVSGFFADVLQLQSPTREHDFAIFELDGFPIHISRSPADISYISIETDDIVGDFRMLAERGAEFVEPIHFLKNGDRAAFFRSPGGIEFMLFQPTRRTSRF